MLAKEVFVNYYNFNPIWVQHASKNPCKKVVVIQPKRVIVKVSLLSYTFFSEPGLEPELEPGPEPKEIFLAPQHCFGCRITPYTVDLASA
jgi:hypothetical protein